VDDCYAGHTARSGPGGNVRGTGHARTLLVKRVLGDGRAEGAAGASAAPTREWRLVMRSKNQRSQMVGQGRIVRILAIVACAISAHQPSEAQSAPRGKQPAQRPSAAAGTTATGCLRDVSDLGGQGGGGAAWQGSVSGHVLIDVRAVADESGSASSLAGVGPATSLLLIRGIPDAELRRFRGQQVEVRGTMASAGEGGRSGGAFKGTKASVPLPHRTERSPVNLTGPQ
jgi:hypothetical protein